MILRICLSFISLLRSGAAEKYRMPDEIVGEGKVKWDGL